MPGRDPVRPLLVAFLLLFTCVCSAFYPAEASAAELQTAGTPNEAESIQGAYYVYDIGKLLTWDEDWELEKKAAAAADAYGCGVYVLTVTDEMQGRV